MRKLALISLIAYLMLALSPFVLAEKVTDIDVLKKSCGALYEGVGEQEKDPAVVEEFNQAYAKRLDAKFCAKPNPLTNSLEKGDCTAAGISITEIVEPISPAFVLSDEEQVMDVYRGICCLLYDDKDTVTEVFLNGTIGDTYSVCNETRTVYFTKLTAEQKGDGKACKDFAAKCVKRQWFISGSGIGGVTLFIKQAYIFGSGIVGFIAVVVIVVSGIQISVSGVTGDITSAKERIMQSIAGLVLLFLSGIILYTINPTFFT